MEILCIELKNMNIIISSIYLGGIKINIVWNIEKVDDEQKEEMVKGFEEVVFIIVSQVVIIILEGIVKGKV